MRLNEAKISDVAVEAGEHLGLYDKENQTLKRAKIVKHLKDVHGLTHKRDIAFVIDAMKTSFPEMKIKENIKEDASTVRLSTLIEMMKDALKKKPRVKNYKKIKDLLPQLEDYLYDHGDKKIPQKELIQILGMTEGQTIKEGDIWVPKKFDDILDKLPRNKMTKGNVLKLAKKFKVSEEDALSFVKDMYLIDLAEGQTLDGGKGDHTNPEDVDENELLVGIEVEYEHAKGDRIAAMDVALDHLAEDPQYYTKLVKSGIVDEPKAIKLAKDKLNIEEIFYKGRIKKVEYEVISETRIRDVIREELQGLLKEEPELWNYIYNFGNTYVPKKQGK